MQARAREHDGRRPALFAAAGAAAALAAIPLAALAGAPYLSLGRLNPWLAVYAVGLFCTLFAVPFAIHSRLAGRLEADARWERALLLWGAGALAVLGLALAVGLPLGFGSESLAGSLALVTAVEAGLVLATLAVWLISG